MYNAPRTLSASTAEIIGYSEWRPTGCASPLVWRGDDIGLGDKPAIIHLVDNSGCLRSHTVAETLALRGSVDAYGLGRVVSALRLFAGTGELHPDDLAAWREVEDEFPVIELCGRDL
ncbi:hypothetical protein P0D88_16740 [Paraburkholderia sp. RL18-103-BIB-C]|uniref:hypothetical protein n=1 Tax=Paraburkholderia sp. RL18-103-BIB-C TaxID=3031637 RepID=UPI0038BB7B19